MPDMAHIRVADDLDAIRRGLSPEAELSPHLARLLAACGGTLRGLGATGRHGSDDAPGETS